MWSNNLLALHWQFLYRLWIFTVFYMHGIIYLEDPLLNLTRLYTLLSLIHKQQHRQLMRTVHNMPPWYQTNWHHNMVKALHYYMLTKATPKFQHNRLSQRAHQRTVLLSLAAHPRKVLMLVVHNQGYLGDKLCCFDQHKLPHNRAIDCHKRHGLMVKDLYVEED